MKGEPIILSAFVEPRSGVFVEHVQRTFRTIGDKPTFWCAYPADGHPFRITTADTMGEAIAKMLDRGSIAA